MIVEEWKVIPEYTGYEVSNTGKVKSFKLSRAGKILKGSYDAGGYYIVDMKRDDGAIKTRFVHRLVCQAFDQNYSENLTVNHIDGDKTNNRIDNLEMLTIGDNIRHYRSSPVFEGKREASQKRGNDKQRGQIYVTDGVTMIRIHPDELHSYELKGFRRGVSDELKEKRRINRTGYRISDETRNKLHDCKLNRVWIHNEYEEKHVLSEELNLYLSKGYQLGQSSAHVFNNAVSQKCRDKDEN